MDEPAHLRVPAARLVAEVHAGLQQLSDAYLSHGLLPCVVVQCSPGVSRRRGTRLCAGQGRGLGSVLEGSPGVVDEVATSLRKFSAGSVRPMRAGPPFPYLRWTGPLLQPARVAARRAAASETSTGSPVTGWAKARRVGVEELARQPEQPCRPYSGSPATGWPIASRWARIWCVRPVSSRTRSSVKSSKRSLGLEVRDGLARLVGVGRDPRAVAAVAADRRVDRAVARATGGPPRAPGTRG